jgi:hypothetical protein
MEWQGVKQGVGEKGGELTQSLYAHMNKIKIIKKNSLCKEISNAIHILQA